MTYTNFLEFVEDSIYFYNNNGIKIDDYDNLELSL